MTIRPKFLRDIMSLIFTLYYLIFADQADEKVTLTIFFLTLKKNNNSDNNDGYNNRLVVYVL